MQITVFVECGVGKHPQHQFVDGGNFYCLHSACVVGRMLPLLTYIAG